MRVGVLNECRVSLGLVAGRQPRRQLLFVGLDQRQEHRIGKGGDAAVHVGPLAGGALARCLVDVDDAIVQKIAEVQEDAHRFGQRQARATAQPLVVLADGARLSYETLIVATGATHHYFGHPEWAELAPGLKSIEDATEMRSRILRAFEEAEQILVDLVFEGGGHAVRRAWIDFEDGAFNNF